MPLHRFYAPPNTISNEEKAEIAKGITEYYKGYGMPAFYVVVLFIDVPQESYFVGGVTRTNHVRITSQHFARAVPKEHWSAMKSRIQSIWEPIMKARGLDFESHIEEHERDLWRMNGMVPPPPNSEAEQQWLKENRPVPF